MDKSILLLILVTFNSFGQEKDSTPNPFSRGQNFGTLNSFIRAGHNDFFLVDRTCYGIEYSGKYDSCHESSFVRFILVKASDSDKYELTKYNDCGQKTRVMTNSEALKYFEFNRNQIKTDTIDERVDIDHTVFYSFYEFKDGRIKTYKYFCKECVDLGEEKSTKEKNQHLKLYRFFDKLDKELSKMIPN
jgi:hypothetical protein